MAGRTFEQLQTLQIGDLKVQVTRKNIKNLNLKISAADGSVSVSAPLHVKPEKIQAFVRSKLDWITAHQQKISERLPPSPINFADQEQHYLWGQPYTLTVVEKAAPPRCQIQQDQIRLQIRPGSSRTQRQQMLDAVYEQHLQKALTPLLAKWQQRMGVKVASVTIRKMKTRWGSCSIRARTIRLNLELAKKPPECLEYVLVHELAHLLEASHSHRFIAVMDKYLPQWRLIQPELNQLQPID
jgi:predicted metal-dependent hydrolase